MTDQNDLCLDIEEYNEFKQYKREHERLLKMLISGQPIQEGEVSCLSHKLSKDPNIKMYANQILDASLDRDKDRNLVLIHLIINRVKSTM